MDEFDSTNPQSQNILPVKVKLLSDVLLVPTGNAIIVDDSFKLQLNKALEALHFQFKISQMLKNSTSFKHKKDDNNKQTQTLNTSSITQNQNKSWDSDFENKMISLWEQGACIQEIAKILERSPNTIISKMQKSSLIDSAAQAHLVRYLLRQKIQITNSNKSQWLQIGIDNGFDPNFGKKI